MFDHIDSLQYYNEFKKASRIEIKDFLPKEVAVQFFKNFKELE